MSIMAHKTPYRLTSNSFRIIVMFSAWGFALVVTSCLFLWLGYLLDKALGTAPKFMFGLFFLAIIGCFFEIYKEVMTVVTLAKNESTIYRDDVRSASGSDTRCEQENCGSKR